MPDNSSSNKRIAKNTLLLYVRMLLLMAVSLYTSRVVLATLGIEDYGLYNVVGGIVTMFTFISMAMGNSTVRYITFALGKGDKEELKSVVSAASVIHFALAFLILLLAETIGLWFLHNKMVIPEGRMVAAEWVYQFSVISCMISIISVPYNAMIVAHEKMGVFAFISILDAVLKLLIVYLIQITDFDKLIFYAFLILCVYILDRIIYQVYCVRHFDEARKIRFTTKIPQLTDMTSFAGWSLIGNLAYVGFTQGLNILLNLFFGPVVNAARGVAVQVQGAVKGVVTNFQTAVNPQIIKSFANEDYNRLHQLIYSSSKFSFYLLLLLVLPIAIEAKFILGIWLKEVPDYAVAFTILTLCISLIEPLSNPIGVANNATGKIKIYQIVEGGSLLLIVPIAYLVLKLGGNPVSVFVVQMVVLILVQIIRLFLVCHKIKMPKSKYVKYVLLPVSEVALLSPIFPITMYKLLPNNFLSVLFVILLSMICVIAFAYSMGLEDKERIFLRTKVTSIIQRKK